MQVKSQHFAARRLVFDRDSTRTVWLNTPGRFCARVTRPPGRVDGGRTMKFIRLCLFCVAVVLGGCSFSFDRSELPANPIPDLNQQKAISLQILKTVQAMRDAKAVGISDAGPNEAQSGPEQWTTCARVDFPTRSLYYTYFVRGEKVTESRPSVINDKCESRTYRPAAFSSSSSIY